MSEHTDQIRLVQAKRIVKLLKWLTGISLAALLPFWYHLEYVIWFLILLPLLSLITMLYYRDIVKLEEEQQGKITIGVPLILPCFGLLVMAIQKYDIINSNHLFLYGMAISFLCAILCSWFKTGFTVWKSDTYGIIFGVFVYLSCYLFSSIALINCTYDSSKATFYLVEVFDKEIEHNEGKKYLLELAPWEKVSHITEKYVSKSIYKNVKIGGKVEIEYKEGLFKIPWIEINTHYP